MNSPFKSGVRVRNLPQSSPRFQESPLGVSKRKNTNNAVVKPKSKKAKFENVNVMSGTRHPVMSPSVSSPTSNLPLDKLEIVGKNTPIKSHTNQGKKRKLHELSEKKAEKENQKVSSATDSENHPNSGEKKRKLKIVNASASSDKKAVVDRDKSVSQPKKETKQSKTPVDGNVLKGKKQVTRPGNADNMMNSSPLTPKLNHCHWSPRPVACQSPVRKPGTPWRECQLRKMAEEQLAAAKTSKGNDNRGTPTFRTPPATSSPRISSPKTRQVRFSESTPEGIKTPVTPRFVTSPNTNSTPDVMIMSPSRRPGTPWRECQLRKLAQQQAAAEKYDGEIVTSPTSKSPRIYTSLTTSVHKAKNETQTDVVEEITPANAMDEGSAVDGELPTNMPGETEGMDTSEWETNYSTDENEEGKLTQTTMSRFRQRMAKSYQRTVEYFREVKNIWENN